MKPWAAAILVVLFALVGCGKKQPEGEPPVAVAKATLAITNVRVFDGETVIEGADVVVDGDKIVAVGKGVKLPAGVETVDGTGRTLLPGLIDGHAHVYDSAQLEQTLIFGVTTTLDMFALPADVKAIKAEPRADRSDLRSAGILATAPGGHGTEYGFVIPTISEPAEAQAFVDARLAEGSDYIKIVYDDGSAYGRAIPTVSAATLRALVEAAHARGKLAVVHIGDHEEARTAIDSGADGIVHLYRDAVAANDFGTVTARHGAFVTPTLTVLRTLQGQPSKLGDDPAVAPFLGPEAKANLTASFPFKVKATPSSVEAAIAQLQAAGVPILVGSDAPNAGTTHGASVHDELALLVAAGLTPTAALAGATALPAKRFALDDRGRIATGLRADLVLVDGDPTTTIADTRRIVAVWRGGVKLDRAAYRARMAEAARVATAPLVLGPISDFEDGTPKVRFGQPWVTSTDALIGGTSTVALTVVEQALSIKGEVKAGTPATWAGAMFYPGPYEFAPIDLSSKPRLSFRARGDDQEHVVMVFTKKLGRMPALRTFRAGKAFAPVTFAWTDFKGVDGVDVMGIFIGHAAPGSFEIVVDDLELE